MKLQVAIAAALATEGLADFSFPVQSKTTPLSETAMNRMKMIETISDLNLGETNKKNRAPQKILWGWQQSLDEAIKEQRGNSSEEAESDAETLDLGILGSVPTNRHADHRRLQVFDFCDATMEEIREQVSDFASKPISVNTDKFCEAVIGRFGPEVCNECGSTAYVDPATGMETGVYSLKIDCPGLIGVTKCKTCADNLQPTCQEKETCPGCGPLCGTCNTNGNDWFIDNQDCMMTYDMRVANEIDKGTPVDLEEAVDFILYEEGMLEIYLGGCEGETLVSIGNEGTDEGAEEKDAAGVASSSVLHSPMPTILRFALIGASWLWMAT